MNELACRHFLVCHSIWYDAANADAGYSLGRVIVNIRPADGGGYPFSIPRLFAYGQLYGSTGDVRLNVRLVRIEPVGYDGEQEAHVNGFGDFALLLGGDEIVESFAVTIRRVVFQEPGLYEFQLWADDIDEPLARERVLARE